MNFIKEESNSTDQFTKWLMISVRVLLILSIGSLIISCPLMLIFGLDNNISYGIMWFSVMGSVLIYYFSILALIAVMVYYKIKKGKVWTRIKREAILLGVSILCLLILGVINNYII